MRWSRLGVVPAGIDACGPDAHQGERFLTQQIEAQAPQNRQILVSSMTLADAALVLTVGGIEDLLHTVLDAPVGAPGIAGQAPEIVASLT
jgi:hypothetical protein